MKAFVVAVAAGLVAFGVLVGFTSHDATRLVPALLATAIAGLSVGVIRAFGRSALFCQTLNGIAKPNGVSTAAGPPAMAKTASSTVRKSSYLARTLLALTILLQITFVSAPAFAARRPNVGAALLNSSVINRINAIRASFGLPVGRNTIAYSSEVLQAVQSNQDPPFAPAGVGVVGEESLWGLLPGSSAVSPSPLGLVNAWVYHDGWEGSVQSTWNADCTSAAAPGCYGHRRAVLSRPPVRGARLYIDVTIRSVSFAGSPALALAALMVWRMPTSVGPRLSHVELPALSEQAPVVQADIPLPAVQLGMLPTG